ncbi:MAG TPA: NAD(P)/FAD-dependent oxidoreductase [Acidimicrobiales bacterium]|jgi:cation diffusion facilitator CzcD-associated flavoprotein CzcO|nr:NAD(P)/FAD-dependent oxidoreductase [Acidimicrobiales bacterium]
MPSSVRPLRVAVIGAGMAGILSAIKLAQAGISDFTVYEKADRVGGTWRENTYPGLSCDVPSHLYSYSFALNPDWTHRFSPGPEIAAYFERVAGDHNVLPRVRFGEEIVSCTFSDGRWQLSTASGAQDEADVVVAATGVLHHPRYPDIAGMESFEGTMFHSSRWDHAVEIDGRRLGIIGTGSTAIQIVSGVVERVASLSMFQRTAQWIMPQENPAFTDEERADLRQHPDRLERMHQDLSDLFDLFANAVVDTGSPELAMIEQACLANLEQSVHDPELRERLRPDYRAACKRLIISPDFYQAIQHPNAELVTDRIERIEPRGVRTADGRLHELDVLVLATGYKANAFMRPMELVGRGGITLEQAWDPRPVAYLSVSVPDFPNFFMLNGPNGPVGNFSLIEVAELQFGYIMQLIDRIRSGECREVAATYEALAEFERDRAEAAANTVWVTGCRSWYLDDRGLPAVWPWAFVKFRDEMKAPDPAAYQFV